MTMFPIDIDFSRIKEVLTYDPQAPMIFSSGIFLWLFTAFLVVYVLLPHKHLSLIHIFVTARNYDNGDMYSGGNPVLVVEQITPVNLMINVSESYFTQVKMCIRDRISAPDFPYAPVAELNNLQSHQISVTSIQRVQLGEYFTTLRNLLQCCADRENSLSQHRGRIYNTTTSYYCQPSSEYYVFTLRHIII